MQPGAKLLLNARIRREKIPELPAEVRPMTPDAAYDLQDEVVRGLLQHHGGHTIGHKIACTNPTAQRLLNLDGPFRGALLSPLCFDSPARLRTEDFSMRVIEAEFAFQMGEDLPPMPAPRTRDEIAAAVATVIASIEIVDSRYADWTTVGAPSLIADNACNGAWVKGSSLASWRHLDLAAQPVRLMVNGEILRHGSGSAVLGHPLTALQWLVNALSSRGLGLRAGEYITTGVTTDIYMAERGDRIVADFDPIGISEVTFD